jgi:hypothetical protein
MRASADLVAGITMLALFAAGTVVIIAAEGLVWTVVGWMGRNNNLKPNDSRRARDIRCQDE